MDSAEIRKDFPILERSVQGKPLVYLDNAATTQKPRSVIDAEAEYYLKHNANVHRGIHTLAEEATEAYECTRDRIASWIGGVAREEVIFTRGTTEAINLVAHSWGGANIGKGDRIVLTQMEHHANLVPWIQLAKKNGAELAYLPIDGEGRLDLSSMDSIITPNTKLVAITQMSNVLGTINPAAEVAARAHSVGAVVLADGAQSAPHMPVDVKVLGVDFFAFSGHKMLGPTGVGALWGRRELLEAMEPWQTGGEMILLVKWDRATWAELPHKFEAGTPNIAGVAAWSKAFDYLDRFGMDAVRSHEVEWTRYTMNRLLGLGFVNIFGPKDVEERGSAISFEVEGVHPHDLAQFLDSRGVAVRAGHHCAQPLTKLLGQTSTTRASGYLYNTTAESDRLAEALLEAKKYFG
ncbi:cysteine desulfurase [bacterium]|nr:cysteine desulfurase [bacterium]